MKFFLVKNCQIHFYDVNLLGKQAKYKLKGSSFEGVNDDFIKAVDGMIRAYNRMDYDGYVTVKDFDQRLLQGTLQLTTPGSLLWQLSVFYGKDNVRVRVTVALSNISNGFYREFGNAISTKEMAVMATCEDTTVKFPSVTVFNMFYTSLQAISALMSVEVEITSVKPILPPIQPKPCNMIYERMLQDEIHSDVVIIAKDGGLVKCHKSVLSTCSSVFEAMFQTDMKESKTHQIEMPDMTEVGVRAFLKYIYYTSTEEPEKSCKIAFELLFAAHKYDVTPDFETAMKGLLLSKPVEWYDVDVAVNLFQFARNIPSGDALKSKSVQVLKRYLSTLKQHQSFQEMFRKNPEAAMELCELSLSSNF